MLRAENLRGRRAEGAVNVNLQDRYTYGQMCRNPKSIATHDERLCEHDEIVAGLSSLVLYRLVGLSVRVELGRLFGVVRLAAAARRHFAVDAVEDERVGRGRVDEHSGRVDLRPDRHHLLKPTVFLVG